MKCKKKTLLICRIIKLLLFTLIAGAVFVSMGIAQPLDMGELLSMWRAERYREVIPLLITYRDCPYGKNVQIDYMIATSCCRIDELSDIGQRYFNRILSSYELSENDTQLIRREREHCTEVQQPAILAFLDSRTAIGSDVGVRGKTYFQADRENAPIGTDLIRVVRDIPIETFQARLFSFDQSLAAAESVSSLAGDGFRISTTPRFTVAAASGQTPTQMAAIGRQLEKTMAFFQNQYGIPLPQYRVTVYITPDQHYLSETARRIHGLQLARGSIGYSHRDDLSICAVAAGSQVGTLKHELFHLMVRNNYGDIPAWLDEGLASLYEVSRFKAPGWSGCAIGAKTSSSTTGRTVRPCTIWSQCPGHSSMPRTK